jgi:hypothetical protein
LELVQILKQGGFEWVGPLAENLNEVWQCERLLLQELISESIR